jgi:hypothetical protein
MRSSPFSSNLTIVYSFPDLISKGASTLYPSYSFIGYSGSAGSSVGFIMDFSIDSPT